MISFTGINKFLLMRRQHQIDIFCICDLFRLSNKLTNTKFSTISLTKANERLATLNRNAVGIDNGNKAVIPLVDTRRSLMFHVQIHWYDEICLYTVSAIQNGSSIIYPTLNVLGLTKSFHSNLWKESMFWQKKSQLNIKIRKL